MIDTTPRVPAEVRSANSSSCCLLNPVLDVAAGTIDVLVEGATVDRGDAERGDDKAWVCPLGQMLGLGDDAPLSAPTGHSPASGGLLRPKPASTRRRTTLRRLHSAPDRHKLDHGHITFEYVRQSAVDIALRLAEQIRSTATPGRSRR